MSAPDELFSRAVRIARPAAEVFAWHERRGAFERLAPPWERVELVSQRGGIRDGARVVVRNKLGPVWTTWEVEHRDYIAGRQFRDVQLSGPFARWEHLHRIEPDGANACVLTDEIRYRLPLGAAGRLGAGFVRGKLAQLFAYRHAVTRADLESAPVNPDLPAGTDRTGGAGAEERRIVVSGASGLVGRALVPFLRTRGYRVSRLVRRSAEGPDEISWDPAAGRLDPAALAGAHAVVHLAGENVGEGRWTETRKRQIVESRVASTRTLVQAIAATHTRPAALISASAIGFYGDGGEAVLDETAPRGRGFLADVCVDWEREVAAVRTLGVRAVSVRTGVVLTPAGGALAKLLPLMQGGLGGRLGGGRQWMSWIAMDDLLGAYDHVVRADGCAGPVNAVAPEPVTNAEFTRVLARVLHRPALFTAPAWGLRLALGQMADEALLAGARVVPARLQAAGYRYREPGLEGALRHVWGRRNLSP